MLKVLFHNEIPAASSLTADVATDDLTSPIHQPNSSSTVMTTTDALPIPAGPTVILGRSQRVHKPSKKINL